MHKADNTWNKPNVIKRYFVIQSNFRTTCNSLVNKANIKMADPNSLLTAECSSSHYILALDLMKEFSPQILLTTAPVYDIARYRVAREGMEGRPLRSIVLCRLPSLCSSLERYL